MPHVPHTNWNYSAINNLKKRPSLRYCLSLCVASLSFLTERKKTLLSSDWSESRLSFLSPLCWQVNLCLVEDERTVAFSTERTEPLLPLSSLFPLLSTVTHIACMGGVLSHFTVLERKSQHLAILSLPFLVIDSGSTFSWIVSAAECDGLEAAFWIGPCQYLWGEG